ncbi:Hint domain-containing protein [Pseudogemmobacter sp. W21_MBD1_M6]|uniref:Hint domain-containing protein n=1 Tax=Pseudogemmobacter sp. W21_MBD1_M6 TaxID=3240271 RepID=UPI003F947CF7
MVYSPPQAPVSAQLTRRVPSTGWTTSAELAPRRAAPRTRKYDIAFLDGNGCVQQASQIAPALPVFESGFAALARGTLIATGSGPVAVEDLLPGMQIQTLDNGAQTLLWIGSMLLIPDAQGQAPEMGRLTRLTTDSLGLGRPMPDLVLGPYARVLHRHASCRAQSGTDSGLALGREFEDGEMVISVTPVTPVRLYHLAFARHQIIRANGVDVESSHPGHPAIRALAFEMRNLLMSLYPHLTCTDGFGPLAYPRFSIENQESRGAA